MRSFLTLILIGFGSVAACRAQSILLETDGSVFRTNETITVVLKLYGATISPAPKDTPGFVSSPLSGSVISMEQLPTDGFPLRSSDTEFTCRMNFRFDKPGEYIIGPYSLNYAGQVLKSGKKTIQIISSENSSPTVTFNRKEVTVGSKFSVTIVAKGKAGDNIKWRENPMAKSAGFNSSSSMETVNGVTTTSTTCTISLTATKAGVLTVNPASFEAIPSEWKFAPVSLVIRK